MSLFNIALIYLSFTFSKKNSETENVYVFAGNPVMLSFDEAEQYILGKDEKGFLIKDNKTTRRENDEASKNNNNKNIHTNNKGKKTVTFNKHKDADIELKNEENFTTATRTHRYNKAEESYYKNNKQHESDKLNSANIMPENYEREIERNITYTSRGTPGEETFVNTTFDANNVNEYVVNVARPDSIGERQNRTYTNIANTRNVSYNQSYEYDDDLAPIITAAAEPPARTQQNINYRSDYNYDNPTPARRFANSNFDNEYNSSNASYNQTLSRPANYDDNIDFGYTAPASNQNATQKMLFNGQDYRDNQQGIIVAIDNPANKTYFNQNERFDNERTFQTPMNTSYSTNTFNTNYTDPPLNFTGQTNTFDEIRNSGFNGSSVNNFENVNFNGQDNRPYQNDSIFTGFNPDNNYNNVNQNYNDNYRPYQSNGNYNPNIDSPYQNPKFDGSDWNRDPIQTSNNFQNNMSDQNRNQQNEFERIMANQNIRENERNIQNREEEMRNQNKKDDTKDSKKDKKSKLSKMKPKNKSGRSGITSRRRNAAGPMGLYIEVLLIIHFVLYFL